MTIVVFVIMTETTADILAIGEIVGTEVDAKRVAAGLRADMAATTVAPVFGTFPASAFAQNVGLVALTGIKSRYAVAAGGGVLLLLGLLPVVGAVVAAIPYPVLGGAGVVLFGSVAASGIRTLSRVDYQDNLNMVIVSVATAVGVIPIAAPTFWDAFPEWFATIMHSGISATALVAVVLNVLFNEVKAGNRPGASVFAAAESSKDSLGDTSRRRAPGPPAPGPSPLTSPIPRTAPPARLLHHSSRTHPPRGPPDISPDRKACHEHSHRPTPVQARIATPRRRGAAHPEARDLRLPARPGVLRRRRHRADPPGQRDRAVDRRSSSTSSTPTSSPAASPRSSRASASGRWA